MGTPPGCSASIVVSQFWSNIYTQGSAQSLTPTPIPARIHYNTPVDLGPVGPVYLTRISGADCLAPLCPAAPSYRDFTGAAPAAQVSLNVFLWLIARFDGLYLEPENS